MDTRSSPKSATTALLLCIFLGGLGIHRFYVGKIGTGILMLITMGGLGIWTLVDIITISICEFQDAEGRTLVFRKVEGSTKKYIFKVLGIVFACFFVFIFLIFRIAFLATAGMVDVARNQLDALQKGDVVLAYSLTSSEFQDTQSLDEFKAFLKVHPELSNNKGASFNSRKMEGGRGVIIGMIKLKNGDEVPVQYFLVKQNGIWKIRGMIINPSAESLDSSDSSSAKSPVSSSTQSSIALPNQFQSPGKLYTVNYPADWEYEKLGNGSVLFSGKKDSPYYYTTVNIQAILSKKQGGQYRTLDDFMADMKKQIAAGASNVKILGEGSIEFPQDGKVYSGRYIKFTFDYKKNPMKQQMMMIYFDKNDTFYSWSYTTVESQYELGLPIVKAMFNSWMLGK